jgi:hypothetical protein
MDHEIGIVTNLIFYTSLSTLLSMPVPSLQASSNCIMNRLVLVSCISLKSKNLPYSADYYRRRRR